MAETPYPSAQAYLDRLPEGLASFPDCKAKASLLHGILASRSAAGLDRSLAPEILQLLTAPPPVSSWVPEVHFNAAALAMYDHHFGGDNLQSFDAWVYQVNNDVFRKPLYRVLFLFVSPQRLLLSSARRWDHFHRGSTLTLVESSADTARLRLEFPPHLFSPEVIFGFGAAWRAAAETAGGHDVHSDLEHATDTVAEYVVRWS